MPSPKTFLLPESYRDYARNPDLQKAYTLIDGVGTKLQYLPPDFTFEQTQAFFEATFALSVIKFDYYKSICELWEKTWGQALNEKAMSMRELTAGEHVQAYEDKDFLTPKGIWEGALERGFDLIWEDGKAYVLWLSCYADRKHNAIHLFAGVYDVDKKSVTEDLLGQNVKTELWTIKDEGLYTNRDLCAYSPETAEEIDIAPLQNAAAAVIDLVADHCK